MFSRFDAHYQADANPLAGQGRAEFKQSDDPVLDALLARYGGQSFNQGLYRVMSADVSANAAGFIAQAFPTFAERTQGFAYDWLGRVFALDSARAVEKMRAILMLEPGTGEVLELPFNLDTFHEDGLIEYNEPALAVQFHKSWLNKGGAQPKVNQCIGYQRPLFLGGSDDTSNLALCDLDVYWAIAAQLIQRVRDLPPGTPISSVDLTE